MKHSISNSSPAIWANVAMAGVSMIALSCCQLPGLGKLGKSQDDKPESDHLYPQPASAQLSPDAQQLNDAARVLAGLPALADQDVNKSWRREEFWRAHATGMSKMWKEFGAEHGLKVRNWGATELTDVATTPVVFQPFGGPDFVFSHLLFPNAETFVVCGQSPCIDMPKLEGIPEGTLADTVFSVREAMASMLKAEREPDLKRPAGPGANLQGALPMLLALAARTGHLVEGIELMPADGGVPSPVAPGQIALDPLAAGDFQARGGHPSSACVLTLRTAEGRQRRLFYFQQDMRDEGLPESAALLQYLNKQDRVIVVVNETAHELHRPNTMRIQQYIAKHAVAIVQDPSGVPFKHFSPKAWNIQKYGTYSGAPSQFREFDQPELIASYNDASSKAQALPFGAGPLGKELPTSLMIARPLVTSAADLPVNVEVTPLPEPSEAKVPTPPEATTATPAVTSVPPVTTLENPAPSAVEASLGGPLAPIDLTPHQ